MDSGAAEASESRAFAGSDGVTLHICCFNGSRFSVQIGLDSTVGSLKSVVAQSCDVPPERQRLIYTGRILMDDRTLESYGLEADHTVHLLRGFAPARSGVKKVASNPSIPNSSPSGTRSVGSSEGGVCRRCGVGASFYYELVSNGFTKDSELFGPGLPILQQVQQRLSQNPNLMREIIDMPSVHNVVDNLNIMQNVIMNDPHVYELIDRNPELAHILTDPSTIRQTLEAARNPEFRREMMRKNTGRAMSYVESCPGGCNRLRGIYENAEEPFLNATSRGGDARTFSTHSEAASNPSAPNVNPLPNPWASGGARGAQTNSNIGYYPAGYDRLRPHGGRGGHQDYQFGSTEDTESLSRSPQDIGASQVESLLSNPLNQQLLTLRRAIRARLAHQPPTGEGNQTRGRTGTPYNAGLETVTNMFGGLGTGTPSNGLNVPAEEIYATQLSLLEEMGFLDAQENLRVLIATTGNVHASVQRLLGTPRHQ